MERQLLFNYIEEKLNVLACRIGRRGKINLLDLNIHSETFFANLCNIIFDLQLYNLNASIQNVEGIDLIDSTNQYVVQVSSTCTKSKIEASLNKAVCATYTSYKYRFISISKDVPSPLKKAIFTNPYNMQFNPLFDIWDISYILRLIQALNIEKLKSLYEFIKDELGDERNTVKMNLNLAKIINIIAKENLNIDSLYATVIPFKIEDKIKFNTLEKINNIINDYKIFYHKVDEIYQEFDKEGKNKSMSILQGIRKQYIELKNLNKPSDPECIFSKIIDNLIYVVVNSVDYQQTPIDELEMYISILVVDAFIRCKIFENPEDYFNVITR